MWIILLLLLVAVVLDAAWNDGAGLKALVKRLFKRK